MERSNLIPIFVKQHLLHAFGPEDLTKMQAAFDRLSRDQAAHMVSETERENLAKAIVTAYDSKMDEPTLLAVALSLYTGSRAMSKRRAWA